MKTNNKEVNNIPVLQSKRTKAEIPAYQGECCPAHFHYCWKGNIFPVMIIQEQQRRFWNLRELLSSLTLEYLWPLALHLWSIYRRGWKFCCSQNLIFMCLPQREARGCLIFSSPDPWSLRRIHLFFPLFWLLRPKSEIISLLSNHTKDYWEDDLKQGEQNVIFVTTDWTCIFYRAEPTSETLNSKEVIYKETNMSSSPEDLVMAWALVGCHNWVVVDC